MTDDIATVRGLLDAAHLPVSEPELERLASAHAGLRAGIDSLYSAVATFDGSSAQVFSAAPFGSADSDDPREAGPDR